ncbi:MAG TPA: hypothetical protein VFB45_14020 [Pseudolabrys sp.]|nr:hypothetical protein [Pseudolabrys sp.]
MVAVTYDRGAVAPAAVTNEKRTSFFGRVLKALMDSRMRAAEREIRLYQHLLPGQLERAGDRLTARNEDALPFGGW